MKPTTKNGHVVVIGDNTCPHCNQRTLLAMFNCEDTCENCGGKVYLAWSEEAIRAHSAVTDNIVKLGVVK